MGILMFTFTLTKSQEVSRTKALDVAQKFLSHQLESAKGLDLEIVKEREGTYLMSSGCSWVIVSKNQNMFPIIAYSLEDALDFENIAPGMESYLAARDLQFRKITKKKSNYNINQRAWSDMQSNKFTKQRGEILPLCQTKWNQNFPYNMFCPYDEAGPGNHTYAGCVATAMSQIMKYYNYPETGRFTKDYWWGDTFTVDFSETTYVWDSMPNKISYMTREYIAELMFHCGVSCDMNYSAEGSSSHISTANYGMRHYFKYKAGSYKVEKMYFSEDEWKNLLKEDLEKDHPILYRGVNSDGMGHAFVCDGFRDTADFHFNWGWGGYGDGWFKVNDMDFSWDQGAVINIMPYDGIYCNSMVYEQDEWTITDGSGPNLYWNNSNCDWHIMPEGATKIDISFERFDLLEGDVLRIYRGESAEGGELIGEYTGNAVPSDITIPGDKAYISFITNDEGQSHGWELNYKATTLGLDDETQNNFSLYPNPANDILNLKLANYNNTRVLIYDQLGREIMNKEINSNETQFNVDEFPKGVYILQIHKNNTVLSERFIKE